MCSVVCTILWLAIPRKGRRTDPSSYTQSNHCISEFADATLERHCRPLLKTQKSCYRCSRWQFEDTVWRVDGHRRRSSEIVQTSHGCRLQLRRSTNAERQTSRGRLDGVQRSFPVSVHVAIRVLWSSLRALWPIIDNARSL